MSKYTVQLGDLLASGYDIGLDEYPIFDEGYRAALNEKIKTHYHMREIGFETPGQFKLYINMTMNEIMPYYNQLYRSSLLSFDPLADYHMNESGTRDSSGTGSNTGSTADRSEQLDDTLTVDSDTPQGLLSVDNIKANTYASRAARQDNTISRTGQTDVTSESATSAFDNYTRNAVGKTGGKNYSEMLQDFRATFINIDLKIIQELVTCFMGIY